MLEAECETCRRDFVKVDFILEMFLVEFFPGYYVLKLNTFLFDTT
jgi:hypothetical protein